MKADFTRNTHHPAKHFTRVLMQQGRVQLDADWNEQVAILLRQVRALARDVIGPHGGPTSNLGFTIAPLKTSQSIANDFAISAGHYYVGGVLCENDPTPVALFGPQVGNNSLVATVQAWTVDGAPFQRDQYVQIFDAANAAHARAAAVISDTKQATRQLTLTVDTAAISWISGADALPHLTRLLTYTSQADYPVDGAFPTGRSHVYLDVWERVVSPIEDDTIREVALGGADTAVRAKVVCQVKVTNAIRGDAEDPATHCARPDALRDLLQPPNRGLLKARVIPSVTSTDPCIVSPTSRYRGAENQLYRVEIHTGARDAAGNIARPTFKWSRENGSVVFPILGGGGSSVVTLETLGRDERFGLAEGDWVEVQDDDSVLLNKIGPLLQVRNIDRGNMRVTLSGTSDFGKDLSRHPLLRRWDQKQGDETDGGLTLNQADNAALIVEGEGRSGWLDLEDGVQIQFQAPPANEGATQYRTGDYWLIPARTMTGDVEWPTESSRDSQGAVTRSPIARPPDGITHYYAPLAIMTVENDGTVKTISACHHQF